MGGKGETSVHLLWGSVLKGQRKQKLGWGLWTHKGLSGACHQVRVFLGKVQAVTVGFWLPAGGCPRGPWQPGLLTGLVRIACGDTRLDSQQALILRCPEVP